MHAQIYKTQNGNFVDNEGYTYSHLFTNYESAYAFGSAYGCGVTIVYTVQHEDTILYAIDLLNN